MPRAYHFKKIYGTIYLYGSRRGRRYGKPQQQQGQEDRTDAQQNIQSALLRLGHPARDWEAIPHVQKIREAAKRRRYHQHPRRDHSHRAQWFRRNAGQKCCAECDQYKIPQQCQRRYGVPPAAQTRNPPQKRRGCRIPGGAERPPKGLQRIP